MEQILKEKLCEICRKQATNICFECFIYLCDSCYKLIHERFQKDDKHRKEKIDYFTPIDTKCPEHPKIPVNLFCMDEKELCCSFCYFRNLHQGHKVLEITDEELLKKENLTLEMTTKEFDDISQKVISIKEKIEKEINEIDKLYDKVNKEMTKSFEVKHEKLIKEENDLREKLQNEVTKIKEKLENFLSESNKLIRINYFSFVKNYFLNKSI